MQITLLSQSFDNFTSKAKAVRTRETYEDKNRRFVRFVASRSQIVPSPVSRSIKSTSNLFSPMISNSV